MAEHLNILIYQRPSNVTHVAVRNHYSIIETETDEGPARRHFMADERFDFTAINRLGMPGAVVSCHNAARIEAAVASLRAAFGEDLLVQCNIPGNRLDRPLNIKGVVADSGKER